MRKFLIYTIAAVVAVMMTCSFFISAQGASLDASTFSMTGGTIAADGTVTLNDITNSSASIELSKDISSAVGQLLGNDGGKLTVTCSYSIKYVADEQVNAGCTLKLGETMHGGSNATFTLNEADMAGAMVLTVRIYSIDATKLESFKITGISFVGTPVESASPSPTATVSATATATATSTATATPTAEPTATPTPTKAPSITYDKVNDNYDDSSKVTNAPPSIVGDVTLDDIATPVPEDTTSNIDDGETLATKASNDPKVGLIILFSVLIALLLADVGIIIWRKKLGFALLINGGIAHRKVRDDLFEEPVLDFLRDDDDFDDFEPADNLGDKVFTPAPDIGDDTPSDTNDEGLEDVPNLKN